MSSTFTNSPRDEKQDLIGTAECEVRLDKSAAKLGKLAQEQ